MRIVSATVAAMATAVMLSSIATPTMAVGPKAFNFVDIFGTPGTPAQPGSNGTNTIVYFGTCKNLAGVVGAGNADANGFCVPYESLTGDQGTPGSPGTPGSGPSCVVTSTVIYDSFGEGDETEIWPGPCSTHPEYPGDNTEE